MKMQKIQNGFHKLCFVPLAAPCAFCATDPIGLSSADTSDTARPEATGEWPPGKSWSAGKSCATGKWTSNKGAAHEGTSNENWSTISEPKSKRESRAEHVRISVIRISVRIVAVSIIGRGGNVNRRWIAVNNGWRLLWGRSLCRRLGVGQPHSGGCFKAGPSTGGLIRCHVLLRGRTGLALNRSVFDNQHALRLLAIDDNRLWDPFLQGLCENRIGRSQYSYDQQKAKLFKHNAHLANH